MTRAASGNAREGGVLTVTANSPNELEIRYENCIGTPRRTAFHNKTRCRRHRESRHSYRTEVPPREHREFGRLRYRPARSRAYTARTPLDNDPFSHQRPGRWTDRSDPLHTRIQSRGKDRIVLQQYRNSICGTKTIDEDQIGTRGDVEKRGEHIIRLDRRTRDEVSTGAHPIFIACVGKALDIIFLMNLAHHLRSGNERAPTLPLGQIPLVHKLLNGPANRYPPHAVHPRQLGLSGNL